METDFTTGLTPEVIAGKGPDGMHFQVKGNRMCHPHNMLVAYDYFRLVIFKEQQTQGKFLFCQRNIHLYRKSPCVRMYSSPYQEKQDD